MAIEALQDGWIPVSERLPEEDTDVLVTVHFMGLHTGRNIEIKPCNYVEIARLMDGEWYSESDECKIARHRHKAIAWRPLPEPYEEQ